MRFRIAELEARLANTVETSGKLLVRAETAEDALEKIGRALDEAKPLLEKHIGEIEKEG